MRNLFLMEAGDDSFLKSFCLSFPFFSAVLCPRSHWRPGWPYTSSNQQSYAAAHLDRLPTAILP